MIIRVGAMILVAALTCCQAQGQSLLLDKGRNSWDFQAAFVGVEESHWGNAGVGYSPSRSIAFGIATNVVDEDRWNYRENGAVVTLGPYLDIYPLRLLDKAITFVFGVHGASMFHTDVGRGDVHSFGASTNVIMGAMSRVGILLKAGAFKNSVSKIAHMTDTWVSGLEVFFRPRTSSTVRLIFEYGATESDNSFTLGIGMSFGGMKAKS